MKRKRILDVTNQDWLKVKVMQGDDAYEQPIRVELADVEFVMGDIPVTDSRVTFNYTNHETNSPVTLTQHTRLSHLSIRGESLGASTFTFTLWATYADDSNSYKVADLGISLDSTTTSDTYMPAQIIVFPEDAVLHLTLNRTGGTDDADFTAHYVLAPAVI